jgi:voltage-dependent calcium channel T type alpha-1G
MILIGISSIALAFESPLNDPAGNLTKVFGILDKVSTILFTFEVIIRVVATGFIFNGKKSYLKDSWHIIDFVIVVFSLIELVPGSG